MSELDPDIHQSTRLRILALLSGLGRADFNFVRTALQLTEGNISSHMARLEQAGYVEVIKGFNGKVTNTTYRLTTRGRASLNRYWETLDALRRSARREDGPGRN